MVKQNRIGEWAFLAFVIIAILAGLATSANVTAPYLEVTAVLVVLGIIVGFLNITEKETNSFLIAAIALLAAGTASFASLDVAGSPGVGAVIDNVLRFIGAFVAPAAVIVALKAVHAIGSRK